jgi:hypothetical protein
MKSPTLGIEIVPGGTVFGTACRVLQEGWCGSPLCRCWRAGYHGETTGARTRRRWGSRRGRPRPGQLVIGAAPLGLGYAVWQAYRAHDEPPLWPLSWAAGMLHTLGRSVNSSGTVLKLAVPNREHTIIGAANV